uniref:TFIIS N-terminal domain-containing protein n=1 Tax=Musca domestica TaxID=7370 RepID=A0A1I8NFB3_MUSDO
MTTSIVEVIQHYQRSIDNSQDNEARLLHCINKLYKLPIKVEHLQETGVGKTVNSLRKFNGEIGVAAKSLVTKWKAMVAAEEEPMDTTSQSYENETQHNNDNDEPDPSPNNNIMNVDEDENRNHHSSSSRHSNHSEKERHKDRSHSSSSSNNTQHKESSKHSSSSKHTSEHKSSSSSSSRDKESHHKSSSKDKEKHEHKSRDKHKDKHHEKDREHSEKRKEDKHKSDKESKNEEKNNHKSSSKERDNSEREKHKERSEKHHKSSSRDKHKEKDKNHEKTKEEKPSSSSKDKHNSPPNATKESSENRKRHNSDTESSDFKSPLPKIAKTSQHKSSGKVVESVSPPQDAEDDDDGFDSTMGTNFDDILGMLDKPVKKGKKSKTSSSVGSSSSGGGSSKESPPKPSTSNPRKNGITSTPASYSPMSTPTPSKLPTAKPDLLASSAKLAPLDPSIALELPTISTNYRPMPLNQTVMDCVFNTSSSSSSRSAPVRTLSDAEALQHGISSKTIRTKIYSGTKTGQIYQVPTLFDMCIRILQKNIDALEYTGGVPFEVLRPVLERATPQQLFVFEDYNPYLMEDSDVLWQVHVSRNYRNQKRLENESWREMFMRCQEDEERRLSFLKDSIKQSQKIAAAPVRKTQLAFVDSMVKPPRNIQRKQEQYGTKSKMVATPAARVAALQSVTPNAAKTGDQRLKVPSTVRDHAQVSHSSVRPKKAPLMQKTLAFMRGRLKR